MYKTYPLVPTIAVNGITYINPNILDIIVAIVKNIVPRINGDPFITFLRYALLLHIMDNSFFLEPKQIKKPMKNH
ncbi:Uncharacterised protein [Streptococcus pneumoniae]|nr:Uncharacterised protein [Streptococcus pneumoniae]